MNDQQTQSAQRKARSAPPPCSAKFRVGDIVEATSKIWRKDGRTELQPGDKATVSSVWQTNPDSPQIICLDIKGKLPMGDIVCFENVPLRLVHSSNGPGSAAAGAKPLPSAAAGGSAPGHDRQENL